MGEVNEIYYIYIYIYKKNTCCNFDVDVIKERKEMIEHSCLKKTRIFFLLSKEIYYYIKVSNSMINLGFINEIYYIYILSSKKYLLQFWLDKDIIKER